MAMVQSSRFSPLKPVFRSSTNRRSRGLVCAAINFPKIRPTPSISLPIQPPPFDPLISKSFFKKPISPNKASNHVSDPLALEKMYTILEAIGDRVEIHRNIGEQRNNWNTLLLTSINTITLFAATIAGIAATTGAGAGSSTFALKLSSSVLYMAATGMLVIMNKIQPSQLVEEQRNASRLFKQLHEQIETSLSIRKYQNYPCESDVNEAMERVLALDKAYPLPLIGVMLEKFPAKLEPAIWWPKQDRKKAKRVNSESGKNGWNSKLEEELREIVRVIKKNDKEDYLRLGEKGLRLNKILAVAGPTLTGLAAIGSALSGFGGWWAPVLGVVGGGLASVVNTLEHGGQVGMVVEMYRGNAGFFKLMEETIESNLEESEYGRRENGELFEMKVALQLGRSLSQMTDVANSSLQKGDAMEEFASKLF